MDSSDLLGIAVQRYSADHAIRPGLTMEFATAYEWAEAALALGRQEGRDQDWLDMTEEFLKKIGEEHDEHWEDGSSSPGNLPNEAYFIGRIGGRSGREMRVEEARRLENQYLPNRDDQDTFYLHDYQALCRGETINVNRSRTGEHLCYKTSLNHPQFILSPLKLEVLSANPPVYVYHEVLSHMDIRSIQHYVSSQLSAAEIQDVRKVDGTGAVITSERTQSSGWLWEHQFPFLYSLARKVGWITGLNVARPDNTPITNIVESEALQIGVYGPGGHYLPHYDTFDVMDPSANLPDGTWVGNRIATVMFYLSDVVGGATAFPKLGIAARPRAGSLVYWHNMESSGERARHSLHGACPTALGIKWVSNKWIREGAQIWKKPCLPLKETP